MVRRLELAQALVNRPSLLILDEPTVGLDPIARDSVWAQVGRMQHEFGMTVLLTTHYMQEADALCDRVALMHHGRLQAVGSPATTKFEAQTPSRGPTATLEDVFRHYAGSDLARTPRRPACVRSGTAEGRRAVSVEQNVRRTDRPCAARLAPHPRNGHAGGRFRARGTAEAAPRPHRAVHQDGAARAVAADLRADVHPAARHRHRRRAVPGVPGARASSRSRRCSSRSSTASRSSGTATRASSPS